MTTLGYGSLYYKEEVDLFESDLYPYAGSMQAIPGNTVYVTTVDDGGELDIEVGAFAYYTFIYSGGNELVYGTNYDTTVNAGGLEYVYSGASTS